MLGHERLHQGCLMTADVVEYEMDLAKAELSVEHILEAAYELLVWRAVALPNNSSVQVLSEADRGVCFYACSRISSFQRT